MQDTSQTLNYSVRMTEISSVILFNFTLKTSTSLLPTPPPNQNL